jgi:hypothetical protein
MKFRKKPVVIEAVQWTGYNQDQVKAFAASSFEETVTEIGIQTLEGFMRALPGDWIIKGVNGEFYPCKPDIFSKTYEPVEE